MPWTDIPRTHQAVEFNPFESPPTTPSGELLSTRHPADDDWGELDRGESGDNDCREQVPRSSMADGIFDGQARTVTKDDGVGGGCGGSSGSGVVEWCRGYDDKFKRHFWYNRMTQESSWTEPAEPWEDASDSEEDEDGEDEETSRNVTGEGRVAGSLSTPHQVRTEAPQANVGAEDVAKDEWTHGQDPLSGADYWFNRYRS